MKVLPYTAQCFERIDEKSLVFLFLNFNIFTLFSMLSIVFLEVYFYSMSLIYYRFYFNTNYEWGSMKI